MAGQAIDIVGNMLFNYLNLSVLHLQRVKYDRVEHIEKQDCLLEFDEAGLLLDEPPVLLVEFFLLQVVLLHLGLGLAG